MEEKSFNGLNYLVTYPKGFSEDKKYPLILFLHGAGTRSNTIETLKNNKAIANIMEHQDKFGFVLVAPHCPEESDWNENMATIIALMESTMELSYIDKKRVYVTGNSMGGYGTWELCLLRPQWFASAMPVCGGGLGGFAFKLVDVPIRTFHGLRDTVVDPIESLQMVKAVNMAGGYAELILFPHHPHNCWTDAYSDEKNFEWLMSYTKENGKVVKDDISGDYYG